MIECLWISGVQKNMYLRPESWPENRDALNLVLHVHEAKARFAPTTHQFFQQSPHVQKTDIYRVVYGRSRGAARRRRGYIGTEEVCLWHGDMRPGGSRGVWGAEAGGCADDGRGGAGQIMQVGPINLHANMVAAS